MAQAGFEGVAPVSGAASAVAAVVMEPALTRMFGVAWVPRVMGMGRRSLGPAGMPDGVADSRVASVSPG